MIELALNATKATRRKEVWKGKYSLYATLQELEAQEEIRLEELLQNVLLQEDFLQDLPSQEDLQAEIEQLTEQMKRDLEECLNES